MAVVKIVAVMAMMKMVVMVVVVVDDDLGAFPAAGVPADDHHLVLLDNVDDGAAVLPRREAHASWHAR